MFVVKQNMFVTNPLVCSKLCCHQPPKLLNSGAANSVSIKYSLLCKKEPSGHCPMKCKGRNCIFAG